MKYNSNARFCERKKEQYFFFIYNIIIILYSEKINPLMRNIFHNTRIEFYKDNYKVHY